jgi:hypothetical protein
MDKILKKFLITLVGVIIVGIIIVMAYLLTSFKSFEILDKDTNSPVKDVTVGLSYCPLGICLGSEEMEQLSSDKNGKVSHLFTIGQLVEEAVFYKEGYNPSKCDFINNYFVNKCSNPIYLKPVKNPVDMIFKAIRYDDQRHVKSDSSEINNNFSLYGQNDINITFSHNSPESLGKDFFYPEKITFYGLGGIQLASKDETFGFLNITEAPIEGYLTILSIGNQYGSSYIFKTMDGKHYGKLYFNGDGSSVFYVFLNPNDNDRNLEYRLPTECLNDILSDPYAANVTLDPNSCKQNIINN